MGDSLADLQREADALTDQVKPFIESFIYGYGDDPIERVIGRLLRDKKLTLSIAESCTGGYVSHLITTIPGSSDYFKGSMVAYSNEVKISRLGVKAETLERFGAVSEETVFEMANAVKLKFGSDIGIATSGIAGPDGGTPDKPVGTIWIAYADNDQTLTKKLQLTSDRLLNIRYTAAAVLNMIRQSIPN
jgi:nicotinamide-nucleotide amidase